MHYLRMYVSFHVHVKKRGWTVPHSEVILADITSD